MRSVKLALATIAMVALGVAPVIAIATAGCATNATTHTAINSAGRAVPQPFCDGGPGYCT